MVFFLSFPSFYSRLILPRDIHTYPGTLTPKPLCYSVYLSSFICYVNIYFALFRFTSDIAGLALFFFSFKSWCRVTVGNCGCRVTVVYLFSRDCVFGTPVHFPLSKLFNDRDPDTMDIESCFPQVSGFDTSPFVFFKFQVYRSGGRAVGQ